FTGCGSSPAANSNTAANSNVSNSRVQNVNANELPPGLSASPIANANDAHPIPSPANVANSSPKAKPVNRGETPTPGIPDPATLKTQMEEIRKRLNSNSNQSQPPPPPGAGDGQMMRKKPRMSNSNN
ncbi:MAG TPA: hypothetical protein PLK77_17490, partial [Pyrinomonadaceae bacterium]|nr:hypothetical protein [Pyrinomonadaceae bacterium]